jgi:hypothetical protein
MKALEVRVSDAVNRVALAGALLPLLVYGAGGDYERPDPIHFAGLAAAITGIAAIVTRRRWAGAFTLMAVLLIGLREHVMQDDHRSSDVMVTTNEAVNTLLTGANPYGHYYLQTNPPGGLFGYPPGEIIFYTIAHFVGSNVFRVDLACSILVLGLIAALAPFCGTGLSALGVATIGWATDALFHLTDGSNDNAAAFLVIAAFSALVWSRELPGRAGRALWWISAFAFGWALAFKEYSAPIAFFIALYLWRANAARARGWIVATLASAAAFVLPFFFWNPVAFVTNVAGALVVHGNIWGRNVWHDWVRLTPLGDSIAPIVPIVMLAIIVAVFVAVLRHPAHSEGAAMLQGLAVIACTFVFARWTTSTYYWFLAPLAITGTIMALGTEFDAAAD